MVFLKGHFLWHKLIKNSHLYDIGTSGRTFISWSTTTVYIFRLDFFNSRLNSTGEDDFLFYQRYFIWLKMMYYILLALFQSWSKLFSYLFQKLLHQCDFTPLILVSVTSALRRIFQTSEANDTASTPPTSNLTKE